MESPAFAGVSGLLSGELETRIQAAARLIRPAAIPLSAAFEKWLISRGFDAKQTRALEAITAAACVRLLAKQKALADFFEQVEYNGRRLAKLDVEPDRILEALGAFDRLLAGVAAELDPENAEELRLVYGQLNFSTVITLNNAFYQVREAETQAFFELHDVELASSTPAELVRAYVEILRRYARAEAACAVLPETDYRSSPKLPSQLATPRFFRIGNGGTRLLLEPAWATRFRSVWSIPLGSGAVQFAFPKDYEWLPRELRLLTGAAERCKSVLEKLRLAEELAARERQVRELAVKMLDTEEHERRRIRRELHDEAAQLLPSLRLHLEMVEASAPNATPALKRGFAEARDLVDRTVVEIRRVLADLSPAILEQLGLTAAVRRLLRQLRRSHGINVRLKAAKLEPVSPRASIAAYRIIQECCNNAARHSGASHLNVSLRTADGTLKMHIEDDGVGFRLKDALTKTDSYGLAGMRERIALAGGRFDVFSRPGRGTRIAVELEAGAPEGVGAVATAPERAAPSII